MSIVVLLESEEFRPFLRARFTGKNPFRNKKKLVAE